MATIPAFVSKPLPSRISISKPRLSPHPPHFTPLHFNKHLSRTLILHASSPSSSSQATQKNLTTSDNNKNNEKIHLIHSREEFDAALKAAKNRLVVVEYNAKKRSTINGVEDEEDEREAELGENRKGFYPRVAAISRSCGDVDFLLVMGDESEETRELFRREGVTRVPHFTFYKGMEKVHEEDGIGPEMLAGDVLYYGDSHSGVVQLHSKQEAQALVNEHKGKDGKLIVLDVGLKRCGPCVKVNPKKAHLGIQLNSICCTGTQQVRLADNYQPSLRYQKSGVELDMQVQESHGWYHGRWYPTSQAPYQDFAIVQPLNQDCNKVYPTVVKLSRSMADIVVFARMNGDENESCMEFLKDMGVVEVPTFLFIRDGDICGRYVGSGKGELIFEILRYQGVGVAN